MPAPKMPKAVRELRGTADRNKHRDNQNAPVPERGIGPAPDYFTKGEVEVWDYLVTVMHPGVLGEPDRPTFEIMAKLFYRFRHGEHGKDAVIPQLVAAELARLDSIMGRYGMTPSDRQKIVVKKGKDKTGFEVF